MKCRWLVRWALLGALGLGACAPSGGVYSGSGAGGFQPSSPSSPKARGGAGRHREVAEAWGGKRAEERPGLATTMGERVKSPWVRESFVRLGKGPVGMDVLYYNDREGLEAMAPARYPIPAMRQAAGGQVEWGLKKRVGYWPRYQSWRGGERQWVEGDDGAAYSIVIKNRCRSRLEIVVSIDGLDVLDGKPAAVGKQGYVVRPGHTLEIEGWRTGPEEVGRFRFSSVGASVAQVRHGDARNVGVIGLAVWGEAGVDPWKWMSGEVRQRETAAPF